VDGCSAHVQNVDRRNSWPQHRKFAHHTSTTRWFEDVPDVLLTVQCCDVCVFASGFTLWHTLSNVIRKKNQACGSNSLRKNKIPCLIHSAYARHSKVYNQYSRKLFLVKKLADLKLSESTAFSVIKLKAGVTYRLPTGTDIHGVCCCCFHGAILDSLSGNLVALTQDFLTDILVSMLLLWELWRVHLR
jgi:hypothetical protein